MWFQLRRILLIFLSLALPMQQVAVAAMSGCDHRGAPASQRVQLTQATIPDDRPVVPRLLHCHDSAPIWHADTPTHTHYAPHSGSTHSVCPYCAGAGASQLIPPTISLPAIQQYALARVGRVQAWRVQFLTSGPDRPPRSSPV